MPGESKPPPPLPEPDALRAAVGGAVLDHALDALVVLDDLGRIALLDAGAARLLGHDPEAVRGRPLEEVLVPAEQRAAARAALAGFRATGALGRSGARRELTALHASGARVPVELTLTRPVALAGRTYVAAALRDRSERQRVEAALESARAEAEAANAAKSRFLAHMSHELRTPLGALIGYADLLERDPDHPDRRAWARRLRRNSGHLLALLNDLLDLSKIEAGELHLEPAPASPLDLLADVEALMRPLARDKGLELEVELTGRAPDAVEVDALRLRQILINLVSNAIKFTDRGRVRVEARLVEPASGPRLRVAVTDTGIGIPAERLGEVFEPFTQVREPGAPRREGTGLGLTISSRLARLLGGTLTVASTPGQGSAFTLEVPVTLATGAAAAPPTGEFSRSAWGGQDPDLAGRRLLVVDDHEANRELLRLLLERGGATVVVAPEGEAGLAAARREARAGRPFDLVLMDMQMPGLDGYAATRRLRAEGFRGPIVALTAHAMAGDRTMCLAAGCDDYLSKPVVPATLRRSLGRLLARAAGAALAPSTEGDAPGAAREPGLSARPRPSADDLPEAARPARPPRRDPRLARLVTAYVADLTRVAQVLEMALAADDGARVGLETHRLAGTADTYGFPEVGARARACQDRLRTGSSLAGLAEEVQGLCAALRAARAD